MGHASDQDSDNVSISFKNECDVKTFMIKKEQHRCTYLDCQAVFTKSSKLQRHIKQHTGERSYTCNHPGCTKSYFYSYHLKRHSQTHSLTKTVYRCSQCSETLSNIQNLKRHYKRRHSTDNKDKIFCEECGKVFRKRCHLLKHQTIHSGTATYKCSKCTKTYLTLSHLTRHEKTHEKIYSCPIAGCSEIFDKWSLLRTHRSKEHITEYKCDKCDKVFSTRRHLKSHSNVHSENRMAMLCPYEKCGRAYFYKFNLENHINVRHLGKKFYCDICSMGFTAKRKLKEHIERHQKPKKRESKIRYKKQESKIRKKRKDIGVPKKSVIGKLIGCKFPHSLEKQLVERRITVEVLEPFNKSPNIQVEKFKPVEYISCNSNQN